MAWRLDMNNQFRGNDVLLSANLDPVAAVQAALGRRSRQVTALGLGMPFTLHVLLLPALQERRRGRMPRRGSARIGFSAFVRP